MALINFTGFDTGDASEITTTLTAATTMQTSVKRGGGYALRVSAATSTNGFVTVGGLNTNGATSTFDVIGLAVPILYATFYFRYATKPASLSEEICSILGTTPIQLRLDSAGKLTLYNNTTALTGAGSAVLAANTWYRIDINVNDTANTQQVKVDGVVDSSGVLGTSGNWTGLSLGKVTNRNSQTVDFYYDDVWLDSTAYIVGDGGVRLSLPITGGTYGPWSNGTGLTFAVVDEVPPNTSDYLENTSGVNQAHTFGMQEATALGISAHTIEAVKSFVTLFEVTSTTTLASVRLRSGSTDNDTTSADLGATGAYVSRSKLYQVDPTSGTAWDTTKFNAIEVGPVKGNDASAIRCSAVYAIVWSTDAVIPDATMVGVVTTAAAISPNAFIIPISAYGVALRATSNLISHYMFFTPDRLKDSFGVNDLTATGTPTYAAGTIDSAASLNGSSQWYKAGDVAAFELQDGSVEAIFYADDVSSEKYIVSKETAGFAGWDLRVQGGLIKFRIGSGSAHFELTYAVNVSTWYHAAVTWDAGGLIKLYLNGVEVDSDTGPASVPYSTEQFAIGLADYGGSNIGPYDGLIDEVAIYGKILNSTEVLEHASAAGFGAVSATMVGAVATASAVSGNGSFRDDEFLIGAVSTASAIAPNADFTDFEYMFPTVATATAISPNSELRAESVLSGAVTTAIAISPNIDIGNSALFELELTVALADSLDAEFIATSILSSEPALASAIAPNADMVAVIGLLAELCIATALSPDTNIGNDYILPIAVATAIAISPNISTETTSPFNADVAIATAISYDANLISNSVVVVAVATAIAVSPNATPMADSIMELALATATALAYNATMFTPSNMIVAQPATAIAISPSGVFRASGSLKVQNAVAVVSSSKRNIGTGVATARKPIGQAELKGNYNGS